MNSSYLANLNPEQRRAVEYGAPNYADAGPLRPRDRHIRGNRGRYVAMTRAKDELDLIAPQRFFTHQQAKLGDRNVYATRSRFIPDSILGSFATRNWRDQTDSPIEVARKAGSSVVDVAASLMRMWR